MGRSTGRWFCSLGALGVVVLLLTLGVVAQMDPRNTSDEYFDAVNNAQCFEHHLEQGFSPFGFRFKPAYSQLPVGEVVEIQVEIFEDTRYTTHETRDVSVVIDKSEAPNVRVITGDLPDDLEEHFGTRTLADGESFGPKRVLIGPGASSGVLTARVEDMDTDLFGPGELVLDADGRQKRSDEGVARMELDAGFFQERGRGNYSFDVAWNSPIPSQSGMGAPIEAEVAMELVVKYEQEGSRFTFNSDIYLRAGHEQGIVKIPVEITSEEEAHLDFEIHATAYWDHRKANKAPRDDGDYIRFLTMDVQGGNELKEARQFQTAAPVGSMVNIYNLLTRLLGFIGLFLVIVAMFSGGVFGKKSRRFLNRATGGAKKRVLWHSSMGFLMVVVASLHFSLALLETQHDISTGLFWGGVAWMLLISLGFTGYYQVRMIKKWNYKLWRHVHLWSAVAVLAFVLVHAIIEGTDLAMINDLLPDRLVDRLLWPHTE